MESQAERSALVTGGSRGIGLGIANALLREGFSVLIADLIAPEKTEEISEKKLLYIKADISKTTGRAEIVDFCKENVVRLDLLVNNAGISVPERKDMLDGSEETLDVLWQVNLKGPYFLTQAIAKWMIDMVKDNRPAYQPKIINIASLTSYASSTQLAEYALSKSAVSMMTKLYADRLSEYGINVYEIRPGIIATKMTRPSREKYDQFIAQGGVPIRRWGMPEDVGKAVAAIAKGLMPYSTGEVINVDGGFHLRRL
jgi:3-oxoacyl-[acyl-carrier protein] reductase